MTNLAERIPPAFRMAEDRILSAGDGFYLVSVSLSHLLAEAGIHTFPDREGQLCRCDRFFDDWFLFAVPEGTDYVYGLLKMREQEHDRDQEIPADGDTPGVTVPFVAFCVDRLQTCLEAPSDENRRNLGLEVNRVVAYAGQPHHPAMKAYFSRPQARAPYLIAETYVNHIASLYSRGVIPVPVGYREIFRKRSGSARYARIPDFLEENNREAGVTVCDHEHIYIRDGASLTRQEKLAILATHTGNVSFHSFAAEVRFHALFLTKWLRFRMPLMGSPYASALRADMSIADREFQGPTPYYNPNGRLLRQQKKYHSE